MEPVPTPQVLDGLTSRLAATMRRDRARLSRRLEQVAGRGRADEKAVARLLADVEAAEARRARRAASVPVVGYPDELPVAARRDDILAAIRDHQVVVVAGETGSGKTTQLPKMCLELGRGVDGMIGHTQPRRIAARTVAERLAEELDVPLGGRVGYAVRFADTVGEATLVKVMTDGILLAEIRRDRLLQAYDTVIVDEAHERSLNIDFLLGYLTDLLPRRPDLKLLITSATIDTARFAAHFDAPVVEVSGRTWPVEIRYRPLTAEPDPARDPDRSDGPGDEKDINAAICDAVAETIASGPGDVLVFLPGERDIRDAADALKSAMSPDVEILPLYARLSAAEQHRVFRPHSGRRIVLATNVAETSLTVPGIRFVVDTGLARVSRYSHRTKVQRLPIEPISQASANQRAGRCGRLGPGICIRLYSEADFESRAEFPDPEILRTNLASVILQMAAIGLGPVEEFPFLEPPDRRSIADGRMLLEELGALEQPDGRPRLTRLGRELAELPVDPRLGRMVIEAKRLDCLREVTVIAAALSIQDPRERPSERSGEAAEMHRRFEVADSDFLGFLALWEYLSGLQAELSGNQFRKRCRAEFLNVLRIREWQDVAGQIRQVTRAGGSRPNRDGAPPDRIHQALLAGLLSHIGVRDRARGDYRGARNTRWQIGRASALSRRAPPWAMAAELVETGHTWARTVARIQPEWAERLGAHLLKHSYSDPWWDPGRGEAVTEETATMYGLPVVSARTVGLGRIDPVEARRIFIDQALVRREWADTVPALQRTAERIATVEALEERVRRRDLLASDEDIHRYFDSILPDQVTSGARFRRWCRSDRSASERLEVPLSVLVDRRGGPVDLSAFPDHWRQGDIALPLRYRFEPAADDDGVTVEIPIAVLNRVTSAGFDWHIPGYREPLVTALVRSLPKVVRRALGPAPDAARRALDGCGPDDGPLFQVLAGRLARLSGEAVDPGWWHRAALPPYLSMTFEIRAGNRVVARDKDLDRLRSALRADMRKALREAAPDLIRHAARSWEFGDLPDRLERDALVAYPALVEEGEGVGVDILESAGAQAASMWLAERKLLLLAVPLPEAHLQRRLTNRTKLALARTGVTFDELTADCATAVADRIIIGHGGPSFLQAGFEAMVEQARSELVDQVGRVVTIAGAVMEAADKVLALASRVEAADPAGRAASALTDVREQIGTLVGPGFVTDAGPGRLRDFLRYLEAAVRRLQRLPADFRRDHERQVVVDRVRARYVDLLDRVGAGTASTPGADLAAVRWMIEELRVSLWAQSLGTPAPVSEARIGRVLERLGG